IRVFELGYSYPYVDFLFSSGAAFFCRSAVQSSSRTLSIPAVAIGKARASTEKDAYILILTHRRIDAKRPSILI
ncbi:MAG: hypothetical protein PVG17_17760, partial [Desulfobacterales bacterium]